MRPGQDFIGVATGALVFNKEGKVLVGKRGPKSRNEVGRWDFPGGSVNFGETRRDAIKREIFEEFGIVIDIIDRLNVQDHLIPDEGQHWVSTSYLAKHVSGEPRIMEPGKCDEFRWMRLYEISADMLTIASRDDFLKYVKEHGTNAPLMFD